MGKLLAVIGANFGDEGKGRTVDWLAHRNKLHRPLVVRHNSGGQAGHTVEREGKRHVFSHFGSASLQGVPTLLTHRFVVNPLIFNREYEELSRLGLEPMVYLDENCAMSTPLDMALNQIRETCRTQRHGTCGVGFGETIHRGEFRRKWIQARCGKRSHVEWQATTHFLSELDLMSDEQLKNISPEMHDICVVANSGQFNWPKFWDQYELMLDRVRFVDDDDISSIVRTYARDSTVIFEGAQGLKLHQDTGHGAPDHATWSRTGTEDILEFLENYDIPGDLEAYYVSRAYITRHGNGPLPNEWESLPSWIIDPTNEPNEWQGSLRAAPFDLEYIERDILLDLQKWLDTTRSRNLSRRLTQTTVLTCADQVPEVTDEMIGFADYIFSSPRNGAPKAANRYRAQQKEDADGISL